MTRYPSSYETLNTIGTRNIPRSLSFSCIGDNVKGFVGPESGSAIATQLFISTVLTGSTRFSQTTTHNILSDNNTQQYTTCQVYCFTGSKVSVLRVRRCDSTRGSTLYKIQRLAATPTLAVLHGRWEWDNKFCRVQNNLGTLENNNKKSQHLFLTSTSKIRVVPNARSKAWYSL